MLLKRIYRLSFNPGMCIYPTISVPLCTDIQLEKSMNLNEQVVKVKNVSKKKEILYQVK